MGVKFADGIEICPSPTFDNSSVAVRAGRREQPHMLAAGRLVLCCRGLLAPDLTLRAVLDKFAAVQMLDVHFPTTDGRTLILSRYTELNTDQKLLLAQINLDLPPQPPPCISAPTRARAPTPPM